MDLFPAYFKNTAHKYPFYFIKLTKGQFNELVTKGIVNPGKHYQRPLSSTFKQNVQHKIVTAEHNQESNVTNIVMRNKPRSLTPNQSTEMPK